MHPLFEIGKLERKTPVNQNLLDMEAKILRVHSTHKPDKMALQAEFLAKDQFYMVPINETEAVEAVIRSISFQYFQNSLPPIAQKLKQLAFSALTMTFSLNLFRQIMALLAQQHQHLKNFKHYFQQMNKQLGQLEQTQEEQLFQLDITLEEDKDYLFSEAQKGQMRLTRILESTEFQQQLEEHRKIFAPVKTITAQTQQTAFIEPNPEESDQDQKVVPALNILHQFYSAQTNQDNNWWKGQKYVSDQSKQISNFNKKGGKLIHQKSITRLVLDEMKRDLNREIELGKDIQKREEGRMDRFNKMIKNKLVGVKMKKKGKK